MTAYRPGQDVTVVQQSWSLAGLVLCFIACFIYLWSLLYVTARSPRLYRPVSVCLWVGVPVTEWQSHTVDELTSNLLRFYSPIHYVYQNHQCYVLLSPWFAGVEPPPLNCSKPRPNKMLERVIKLWLMTRHEKINILLLAYNIITADFILYLYFIFITAALHCGRWTCKSTAEIVMGW